MEGVFKRKSDPKNWRIRYTVDGKRIERRIGTSKRKAEHTLITIKGQITDGTYYAVHGKRLTFAELVERYFENPKYPEKKTLATDHYRVKPLLRFFGRKVANTITAEDVKRYVKKRRGDISERTGRPLRPGSINRELGTLSVIYATGILHRLVANNPACGVPRLKEDNIRNHNVTHADFLRLLEALPDSPKSGPWRPFIATAYYTGMRKGEILKLTWDRVDLKEGWFILRRGDTKTNQARRVPIPEPLRPYLEALPRETPGFFLFTHRGKWWEAKDFTTWKLALKEAGLDETLHIHDMRHCYVTNAVRAGIPEDFIMKITGHRTRSVFGRYVDVSEADLRAVVKSMVNQW